jgi:octaprenyl-diphosphate synthase
MVADAPAAHVEALATYGDALGVAFQIIDDLLDYGGVAAVIGKDIGDDFREGKATLPVLLAHARGDDEERAFWHRVIEKRDQREGDLEHALTLMDRRDALAETRAKAAAHIEHAVAALSSLPETPMRAALVDIAGYVVARAY